MVARDIWDVEAAGSNPVTPTNKETSFVLPWQKRFLCTMLVIGGFTRMTEFENIVIGKSAIPAYIVTIVLMAVIVAITIIYWFKKHKQQIKVGYLIAGAIGFVVSARVLETIVHFIFIVSDNPASRFINGNTVAYVIYGTLMAGLFEEIGRFVILKYIVKKNRTRENAVLYGIGHGSIEIIAVLVPSMVAYLAIAIIFSVSDVESALSTLKITEENAGTLLPTVQVAAKFDFTLMALNIIERVFAMCVHIGLTVIVYYGIVNAKKIFLPLAIVLHMAVDTLPALYQRGAVPLWSVEVWMALWAVAIAFVALGLYKKLKVTPASECEVSEEPETENMNV